MQDTPNNQNESIKKKKSDRRSETSKANILKAQQTKAERQRQLKSEINEFVSQKRSEYKAKKSRYQKKLKNPDSVKQSYSDQRPYAKESEYHSEGLASVDDDTESVSSESTESSNDELVIKTKRSTKSKSKKSKPKKYFEQNNQNNQMNDDLLMELKNLKSELNEIKHKNKKKETKGNGKSRKEKQPMIQIVNPPQQLIMSQPQAVKDPASEEIKRNLLFNF